MYIASEKRYDTMPYNRLGASGLKLPAVSLGLWHNFGDTGRFETMREMCFTAFDHGITHFDLANNYGPPAGTAEINFGRILKGDLGAYRDELIISTKAGYEMWPGPYGEWGSRKYLLSSLDQSLKRMGLDYVDMMLLHHPDKNDVKAYKAMEKYVEQGKIRSLGLSNWYVEELEEFLPQVNITPALVQNEIHPYYQENDVIPYIQGLGIVVQGWYPLGGRGYTAELLGNEVISEIARAHGKSSAQVILRWNLQKGVVVIPGSSNPDHIRENTELFDFELTEEEMERIHGLDRNEKHDWY